jgi:hypothetical protein
VGLRSSVRRPAGFISFEGWKTENNFDFQRVPVTLRSSMQRTPNAAKKSHIFAFVARISLR